MLSNASRAGVRWHLGRLGTGRWRCRPAPLARSMPEISVRASSAKPAPAEARCSSRPTLAIRRSRREADVVRTVALTISLPAVARPVLATTPLFQHGSVSPQAGRVPRPQVKRGTYAAVPVAVGAATRPRRPNLGEYDRPPRDHQNRPRRARCHRRIFGSRPSGRPHLSKRPRRAAIPVPEDRRWVWAKASVRSDRGRDTDAGPKQRSPITILSLKSAGSGRAAGRSKAAILPGPRRPPTGVACQGCQSWRYESSRRAFCSRPIAT